MSAVDDLAEMSGQPDPAAAGEILTAMWQLGSVDVRILRARITGRGRDAAVEVFLSNGETMVFEQLSEINGTALATELAACAGVAVSLKPAQRLQSIVLIRMLAERLEAETADSIARWWGIEFLGICQQVEADMTDQGQRWAMFERLRETDPFGTGRENGSTAARHMLVPVDQESGVRFVRIGWYQGHVRQVDGTVSSNQVVNRMMRVGWHRRGAEGRIKASRPDIAGQTNIKFLLVPRGWENDLEDDGGNRK